MNGNSYFIVKSHFILDLSGRKLIQYFGHDHVIVIPHSVEILCSSCCSTAVFTLLFRSVLISQIYKGREIHKETSLHMRLSTYFRQVEPQQI
jgi:hypothetical protein